MIPGVTPSPLPLAYTRRPPGLWLKPEPSPIGAAFFIVALIDGNLAYRTMTLHVTAEKNFRVDKLKVYGRAKTVAEVKTFKREASALVAKVSRQTQAGCTIEP